MSIPVLTQVYDEVRRLAIAGSALAGGDFRLKKLAPPLAQAGQKAPVFAKVAQAVEKVVASTDKTSAEALLELSTLVNAILYTQGETGTEGEFAPLATTDLGQQQTQASARVLKPLLEALSTTGSGRLEIITDAFERGAFRDLRLIKPAIGALDDSYAEIGDFVAEKILPLYGQAILPELRARFDQKGRGGHVRRLALMHQLDPAGTREIVKQALDEGSKEVKVAAIECLGSNEEDLPFLLEQAKSKARDVREAALKGLARSDAADATRALEAALRSGDLELAVEPIRASRNPQVLKLALAEAGLQRAALLATKEKDKKALGKEVSRFLALLECLRGRDDGDAERFLLESFAQREALAAVKGEPSGKDIHQRLVSILAAGSKKAQHALVEAHRTLSEEELVEAFVAAGRTRPASEVFDLFSPYLAEPAEGKKRKGDPAAAKRAAIVEVLVHPRWLDLAVRQQSLELVQALARPGHAGANQLLTAAFDEMLKKSKDAYELGHLLDTMVRVQHPTATDSVIAAIAKHATGTHAYGLYWIGQLIPHLPPEALPKLESLLPTLPEKAIDQVLDHVTQLKNRLRPET
jgi:hypothetical protein